MLQFVLLAVAMTIAALAFVVVPLWRRRSKATANFGASSSNVVILRAQRDEILRDHAAGAITDAERDEALRELAGRLSEDIGPADAGLGASDARAGAGAGIAGGGAHWSVMVAVLICVPVLAGAIYWKLGRPDAFELGKQVQPETPQFSDQQILAMVDTLSEKMKAKPDDVQGWLLLARSQGALRRFPEAVKAFEQANRLQPGNAQILADYADAFAMTQQQSLDGKPAKLLEEALTADPDHKKSLALAGTMELNRRNFTGALKHWERLKRLLPPDSDDAKQVEGAILEVKLAMGGGGAQAPVARGPQPMPEKPGEAGKPQKAGQGTQGFVAGTVKITPDLAKKVALTDTLFIFARSAQQGGPRMPLAVMRVEAKELPKQFELTDAMAMAPNFRLSDFPEVIIEARVSKSGNAQSQPGDLLGVSKPVRPGERGVNFTIDRVVP
jgi:cytochrome c-type biogenesis protein CcmH